MTDPIPSHSTATIPTGPLDKPPTPPGPIPYDPRTSGVQMYHLIGETLNIRLGAHDEKVIAWLAAREPSTLLTILSWISRTQAQARELLQAVAEGLDIPAPATVGDESRYARVLRRRAAVITAVLESLRRTGSSGPSPAHYAAVLRDHLDEYPPTGYLTAQQALVDLERYAPPRIDPPDEHEVRQLLRHSAARIRCRSVLDIEGELGQTADVLGIMRQQAGLTARDDGMPGRCPNASDPQHRAAHLLVYRAMSLLAWHLSLGGEPRITLATWARTRTGQQAADQLAGAAEADWPRGGAMRTDPADQGEQYYGELARHCGKWTNGEFVPNQAGGEQTDG